MKIPLTQGQVALVDDEDFEWLSHWNWCADLGTNGRYYAHRVQTVNGRQVKFRLHRVVLGLEHHNPLMADHISGDTLDNRRCNLRVATASDNRINARMRSDNTLGYRGIWFHRPTNKFVAAVQRHGKRTTLGSFPTAEEAARAYDSAAKQLHGTFARLNFKQGDTYA